jgi:hypothetical protein
VTQGITFRKLWSDDEVVELEIAASDGQSNFQCKVYAGHAALGATVEELTTFKHWVHGGIFDLRLGQRGPEYASGAFHARLHFHPKGLGRLFMTIEMESGWFDFTVAKVANRYVIHLVSEPALLDNFIDELAKLHKGSAEEACLQLAESQSTISSDGGSWTPRNSL